MAKFLSVAGRATVAKFLDPIGAWLFRIGISPNAVTVLGTGAIVAGSVVFVARGQLLIGLIVITLAAFTDLIDGAMARARGYASRFGALLDSTMDRIADGAVFAATAYWLAISGATTTAAAALACLVFAQVISYIKSRAESLGARCDVGLAERAERLIVLGVGGLLEIFHVPYGLAAAIWVLAVVSLFTIGQRMWHVRQQLTDGAT
ncbi:MAG TPA: CDP-alcohol phosphatidyltransferase family protein [Candidatus Stackebrandtia faecavium]|nr:CDP-alcohol phosphatidyltransferase family protein [Candidatus Stackebrandtia faecavium]